MEAAEGGEPRAMEDVAVDSLAEVVAGDEVAVEDAMEDQEPVSEEDAMMDDGGSDWDARGGGALEQSFHRWGPGVIFLRKRSRGATEESGKPQAARVAAEALAALEASSASCASGEACAAAARAVFDAAVFEWSDELAEAEADETLAAKELALVSLWIAYARTACRKGKTRKKRHPEDRRKQDERNLSFVDAGTRPWRRNSSSGSKRSSSTSPRSPAPPRARTPLATATLIERFVLDFGAKCGLSERSGLSDLARRWGRARGVPVRASFV